jgi:thiamine monophosphate synthase
MSKQEIYRILDAAINRGREALRVVEDAARFIDDNEALANALKETRRQFTETADKLDRRERLLARDATGDVGAPFEEDGEDQPATLADVLSANFARLQESARSLEEFSKLVAPQLAREWEKIRYEAYALEKSTLEAAVRRENAEQEMPERSAPDAAAHNDNAEQEAPERSSSAPNEADEPRPKGAAPGFFPFERSEELTPRDVLRGKLNRSFFAVCVDRPLTDSDAETLFNANVGMFQLCYDPNDPNASPNTILFLDQYRRAFSDESNAARRPLLLTRDFTVWADDLDGGVLHQGDWQEVRAQLGENRVLGVAVSNLADALRAFQAGKEGIVDFIEAGPVFDRTGSGTATGTAFLRAILEAVDGVPPIPVFVFGGITSENCVDVFDSGVERFCVGASIMEAQDKRFAAMQFASLF